VSASGWLIFVVGAVAIAWVADSHRRLMRALSRSLPGLSPPPAYPSVTVIRPIRGLDVGAKENLQALLSMDYPGALEILCVFDSETDPAYPLVRDLIAQRKAPGAGRAQVLIAGAPPSGRTGKLNAMLLGVREARSELVAFNDSDTRPGPKLLRHLVDALLSNPRAGATFAPIVAVCDAPRIGDVGYALLVNAWYSPSVALVSGPHGELPFIMGQLMVFRPEALESIGGVGCAEGQLVDDMYIGKRITEAGWQNVMITEPLPVVTGGMGLGQFLRTFRRWILFSQGGLPKSFTRFNWGRGVAAWLAWVALAAALVSGQLPAAIAPAAAVAAFAASQLRLQRSLGGPSFPAWGLWMAPLLPIVATLVALSTRLSRKVDWRGRSYSLDRGARLGSGSATAGR